MSTLQFNQNGPIIVTMEDFGIFQRSNYSSFDQMFYAWLDENNPNGVRRLLIRDLLRQAHGENDPEITYHHTDHGFGRIMCVGGGKKDTKDLYWTLHNRPRLLEEITSEFLYDLEHGYVPIQSIGKEESIKLIELLLTVAKPEDTKDLWQHHPLNVETNMPLPKRMSERLRLYTGRANLPQTIRNELWQKITCDLIAAINAQKITLLANGIPPIAESCMVDIIVKFVDALKQESYHNDRRSTAMVTDCVGLLEKSLPHAVTYLDHIDMERILPKITDRWLASASLCRHITATTAKNLSYCSSNFLYWAHGIITLYDAEKAECLKKIDTCLSDNTDFEIVFQ